MEERLMINLLRSIARMELNDFFSSAPSLEEFVKNPDSDKILSMNKLQLLFFKTINITPPVKVRKIGQIQ